MMLNRLACGSLFLSRNSTRFIQRSVPVIHQCYNNQFRSLCDVATKKEPPANVLVEFTHKEYDEPHPSDAKMIMTLQVVDLELSKVARARLLDIVGPRYNPKTDTLKLTCDKYPLRPQNKKFLKELLANLVEEARSIDKLTPEQVLEYKSSDPFYAVKPTPLEKRLKMYQADTWDSAFTVQEDDEFEMPQEEAEDLEKLQETEAQQTQASTGASGGQQKEKEKEKEKETKAEVKPEKSQKQDQGKQAAPKQDQKQQQQQKPKK